MKISKLKEVLLVIGAIVCGSSIALADVEYAFNAKERQQPSVGVSGSAGAGISVIATGIIRRVEFVELKSKEGRIQNVVAVTFNESSLPSGDVETDTIYFSGADAQLGLSLSGAIGKKIQANSQSKSFTISEK